MNEDSLMAMLASDIEAMIRTGFPDAFAVAE